MNKAQHKRFDTLYQHHVNALLRQGKAGTTIDAYSRAVRRIVEYYDICPDHLTQEHLKEYFTALVKSHSWSTVKVDRNGLQFFYKHTLGFQDKSGRKFPFMYSNCMKTLEMTPTISISRAGSSSGSIIHPQS